MSIWEEKDNPMVRMHHPLVTAPFGYMELNTMRLFLLMLARWDWNSNAPVRIPLRDVIPNYKGGSHFNQITLAVQELKLKMKDVKIEKLKNGKKSFSMMTVIDYLEYIEGTDYVEGSFGTKIGEYLRDLRGRFTTAELKELFGLRSTYAIRLYMIGKSFYPGFEKLEITLEDFRTMMVGESDKHKEYKVFKRDVIQPNIKALLRTTGAIVIEEKRKGRAVHTLLIRPATSLTPALQVVSPFSEAIQTQLEDLSVNTARIAQLLREGAIDEGYIQYVINQVKGDAQVQKPGAVIHQAIIKKKGWKVYQLQAVKATPSRIRIGKPIVEKKAETVRYSYDELIAIHAHNVSHRKTTIKDFKEWVKAIYLEEGFERKKLGDTWYVVLEG
jgi:plasmid replication initiation protein